MPFDKSVNQVAYAVTDIRGFATKHSRLYGSGPFLMIEDFEMSCNLRGKDVTFTVDVAFGQWGEMQVEIMQQKSSGPGIVHDLYPEGSGRSGIHHLCSIVDDLDSATAEFEVAGYEVAVRASMPLGTNVVHIDTAPTLGHFTELYTYTDEVRWLYEGVKAASIGFDGSNITRPIKDYMPSEARLV